MSEPQPPAEPAPAEPPSPRPPGKPAERLDRISALLLAVAAGGALSAAAPALIRAAGHTAPAAEPTASMSTPPLDLAHQPPELLANPDPLFDPDRDGDDDAPPPSPLDVLGGDRPKLGLARSALALSDKPGSTAKPIAEVKPGELVMILHESGDWVQVYAPGRVEGTMIMGWTRKSGIAVR